MKLGGFPQRCFDRDGCPDAVDCVMWGCAKDHGSPPRSTRQAPTEAAHAAVTAPGYGYPKSDYLAPATDAA